MIRPRAAFAAVLFACFAAPSFAQDTVADETPAHVSFVDGDVVLERDGRPDTAPASMPLLAGDRVRTNVGRVEILFADGSALHADNHTVVDFQSDEVVRLLEGRMRLSIPGQARDLNYRVDGPAAWVQIVEAGEYRISVVRGDREPQVELAVLRGAAELVNENGSSLVRAGERAFARAGAQPSSAYVFNSAAWDAFDQWSEARRDQRLGVSAQYLPSDVRPYSATFDHYGSWRHDPAYGYVWYPRVVSGWRPYHRGRWVTLRPYGWTWIAHDPWGWPTHHYGRWGFSSGAWFWIPGSRWSAAWVSWAYAPTYVSWCPLGWNNRPVFSFVNINIFGGRRYEPWHAWTVVPRHHFNRGFVNVRVASVGRIDSRVRRTFVVRDTAPDWRYASRASAPIRVAGTRTRTDYAVPRGSVNSPRPSLSEAARGAAAERRGFPAPARESRAPGVGRSAIGAPVTPAPDRAVPRDRGERPDARLRQGSGGQADRQGSGGQADRQGSGGQADRRGSGGQADRQGPGVPAERQGSRGPAERRGPEVARPGGAPTTVPPPSMRAVPRGSGASGARQSSEQPSWGRYDRQVERRGSDARGEFRTPEYRSNPGVRPDAGDRRAPERGGSSERYRAIPRQDAPRPSYEAPRESSPRYAPPPRQESRPPSYGAPERRGGSGPGPSADRPSRSEPSRAAPSRDGGRSRGERPSSGHATRRPGGRN